MIAVIYARYSSDGQRDESIDGQLRECYRFKDIVNKDGIAEGSRTRSPSAVA